MGAMRRGHGEDAIYFDHGGAQCRDPRHHRRCPGRWRGVISLGFSPDGKRIRRKVSGKTKAAVSDAHKALHDDLDRGLRTTRSYTVRHAVDDWLRDGLPGRSERTRALNREATTPLLAQLGSKPLVDLSAGDVRASLDAMSASLGYAAVRLDRVVHRDKSLQAAGHPV